MSNFKNNVKQANKTIASQLKTCRLQLALTMATLNQKLDTSANFISKIELAGRRIDVGEFVYYCAVLDINPVAFIRTLPTASLSLAAVIGTDAQSNERLNPAHLTSSFKAVARAIGFITSRQLQKIRSSEGLTMRALGSQIAVVHSYIGKIEQGTRRLDIGEFIYLIETMNQDPAEMLREIITLTNEHATVSDIIPSAM